MTATSTEPVAGPPSAPLARWSYLTVPVVAAGFEDARGVEGYQQILNEYGRQGWELAGVTSYPGRMVEGWIAVLFFKRPAAVASPC